MLALAARGLAVGAAGALLAACRREAAPTAAGTPDGAGTPAAAPGTPRPAPAASPATPATVAPTATATPPPATPSPPAAPSPTPSPLAGGNALLRVLHASPDAPELTVTLDGRAAFSLGYTDISRHQLVPPGAHSIQLVAGGAPVVDLTPTLQAGRAYTVVAANALAQIEGLLVDDDLTPPPSGRVRFRVLHAAADAPAVDVAVEGGQALASDVAYKAVTEFQALDAGVYTFAVRQAGTAEVAFTTRALNLAAGDIYTAVLLGLSATNTLRLIVYPDNE